MKKRKVKSLSLKKNTIASMESINVLKGGAADSGFVSCVPDPLPSQKQTCQYSCDPNKSCYCFTKANNDHEVYVVSL